jgi:Sec-independent protein translocase protein TatA
VRILDNDIRLVVGVLGDSWVGNHGEEDWFGLLDLGFERFDTGQGEYEYSPLNLKRFYCNSHKAFVTRNFHNLREQFSNGQLLLIESERSNNPGSEQDYVVDYLRVQKLPANQLFEIINVASFPEVNDFTLVLNKTPSTDYIMLSYIDNNSINQLVGPFSWEISNNEFEHDVYIRLTSPSRTPITGISLSDYYSYEVPCSDLEQYIIEAVIQDETKTYIVNSKQIYKLFTKHGNRIDVMQDDRILKDYASDLLKAKPFNGLTAKSLDLLKANINMATKSKNNKPRLMRALALLQKAHDWQQERNDLFSELLQSEQGSIQLEQYIKSNEKEFFKQLRKDDFEKIEYEINDELTKLTLKEKTLRSTIRDLGQAADAKRKEQADMEAEYRAKAEDKVRKELEQEKIELQLEVSKIKSELDEYKTEYTLYETLESLVDKNKKLSEEHAGLTSLNLGLEATKIDLEKTIAAASKQLTEEYVRVHSLFKAMTSPVENNELSNVFPDADINGMISINTLSTPHVARREYIDAMEFTLRKFNRNLSRENVVNLVVTLAQSQFTIFAGLPGSGKTSIIKIIGKAMQLGSRQHTIPVAKAWTSTKDILGYYNGLSGSYHAAPTGLWGLLNNVQNDKPEKSLPVLLLLDEMNLSSPEHYFSSFLDLADDESNRQIFTGHPDLQLLSVPEHFKFIGTINQDETVQPLSPRMLDRAAIILFDGAICDDQLTKDHGELLPKYPAKDWLELFSAKGDSIPSNVSVAFDAISNCISCKDSELGQRHVISHRKINQINNYIEVANSILIDFDDYLALDHAVAQYVLPMISGYGEGYGNRLKKLLDITQTYGMEISSELLIDIINNGEQNLYSYRFLM